jgi:hypothetical protein
MPADTSRRRPKRPPARDQALADVLAGVEDPRLRVWLARLLAPPMTTKARGRKGAARP